MAQEFNQQMSRLRDVFGEYIFSDAFIAHYRACFESLADEGKRAFLNTISSFGKRIGAQEE